MQIVKCYCESLISKLLAEKSNAQKAHSSTVCEIDLGFTADSQNIPAHLKGTIRKVVKDQLRERLLQEVKDAYQSELGKIDSSYLENILKESLTQDKKSD